MKQNAPRLMTVEEYLHSDFEHDFDYVDGRLEERDIGESDHATIQAQLIFWLKAHDLEWNTRTRPELRVQVSPTRFRVPDVCVTLRDEPVEQIQHRPPLICIEVRSPESTVSRLREKLADYHRMGVPHVWLIDPAPRVGYVCTEQGWNEP